MTAVILLAHGSPDPRAARSAHALADEVAQQIGQTVRAAFLQHDEATLAVVAEELRDTGASAALVVPTLLSRAFHARVDVPAELERARECTGLTLRSTDALGPDPSLLAALDRELPAGPRVLAAAGTTDIHAQQQLDDLAVEWSRRTGEATAVAYAALASPDLPTAIAELEARAGARASVGAFVLFPGVLPDRLAVDADGRTVSRPLFSSTEVVALIERRVTAALRTAA